MPHLLKSREAALQVLIYCQRPKFPQTLIRKIFLGDNKGIFSCSI